MSARLDADDLARLGEQIVKLFSPPPVVTRVLLERRAGRLRSQARLMFALYGIAMLYGDSSQLVHLVAFNAGKDADPIPWYGLRAAHIQQIADFQRGRLSPKAHRRLCRVLVEGMTVVYEAGRISTAELAAIKTAAGVA